MMPTHKTTMPPELFDRFCQVTGRGDSPSAKALRMVWVDGAGIGEAAQALGMKRPAVDKAVVRGRAKLAEIREFSALLDLHEKKAHPL